ncbi:MAG: PC4/YdbC family ssDNA-binding protein [Candidatus Goldbacteria bacterium]|nr:PC4/YdbC family ssDNA-binding protein [Candidatus Goldiibacteriota bacterium]
MPEPKYEIIKNLGCLSESSGWKKEINIISWNDKPPKVDIRSWDAEHKRMSKGITLNKEEVKKLREFLASLDIEKLEI